VHIGSWRRNSAEADRPLSYRELAPLLQTLPSGKTPLQIAQSWSNRMPLESGMAIAGWLINHGILVERHDRSGLPL